MTNVLHLVQAGTAQAEITAETLRITVVDRSKLVSFPGENLLTRQIAAACASNPASLEDLLLAAEPLRPGLTRWVINGLLHFDRHYLETVSGLPSGADATVFEAFNPALTDLALQGLAGGLALFDLTERMIYAAAPLLNQAGTQLKREDELPVWEQGQLSKKTVTYSLDKSWKVLNLAVSPAVLAAAYRARPSAKR